MKLTAYHFLKRDDNHTNCISNLNLKKALHMSSGNFSKVLGPEGICVISVGIKFSQLILECIGKNKIFLT